MRLQASLVHGRRDEVELDEGANVTGLRVAMSLLDGRMFPRHNGSLPVGLVLGWVNSELTNIS